MWAITYYTHNGPKIFSHGQWCSWVNFYGLSIESSVRCVSSTANVLLTKTELRNLANSTPTSGMVLSTLTLRHSTLRNDSSKRVIRKAADTITSTDRCGPRFWKASNDFYMRSLMSAAIKAGTNGLHYIDC
jgi:hypothetical protein